VWKVISKQLKEHGPVYAMLSEDEYLYLKRHFKKVWRLANRRYWTDDEQLVALGYLRGYTLFREVPENDRQFWGPFLEELGVQQEHPSRREFDELWTAFSMHPETKEYLVIKSGKRMLVQTIDRIWGVKGLRAGPFGELLTEYLKQKESGVAPDIEAMLKSKTGYEYVYRHAGTYKRIFEGIARLLDALRDEPEFVWNYFVGEISEEEFIETLQSMGLFFSRPHPFAYVRNKSERLLRNLLVEYVKFNAPTPSRKTEGKGAVRTSMRRLVEVRLVSGESLANLPGLEGLEIIPDVKYRPVLQEGRRIWGEARVSSGALAPCKFSWRPRLDESGNPFWVRPEEEVVLGFGENEIRLEFELLPKNVLRLELSGFREVLEWTERDQFSIKSAPHLPAGHFQYSLASQERPSKDLDSLLPLSRDTLHIDYVYRGEAFRLESVPVRFEPRLVSWKALRSPHGVEVHVKAELPKDGIVLLQVRTPKGLQQKELKFSESGEYSASFQVDHLLPAEVKIELHPDGASDIRALPPEIDWKQAFRAGIGIGKF